MLYDIAGLRVSVEGGGERFLRQAQPYVSAAAGDIADISVRVTDDQVMAALPQCSLSADDCRYILSGMRFYFELLTHGGMMLHSSAVGVGGKAYIFSGNSGVGKSTHTANWLKLLGDEAFILNDDKPALRLIEDRFFAYGTPWSGKHDISRNVGLPVAGIAFIERAAVNSIERIPTFEAAGPLLAQTTRHIRAERMNILLELVSRLIADVPIYRLCCTADVSSAEIAYETMRRVPNEN